MDADTKKTIEEAIVVVNQILTVGAVTIGHLICAKRTNSEKELSIGMEGSELFYEGVDGMRKHGLFEVMAPHMIDTINFLATSINSEYAKNRPNGVVE